MSDQPAASFKLEKGKKYSLLDFYGMIEHSDCEYIGRVEPRGSTLKHITSFNNYYLFHAPWHNDSAYLVAQVEQCAGRNDEIKVRLRICQWGKTLDSIIHMAIRLDGR